MLWNRNTNRIHRNHTLIAAMALLATLGLTTHASAAPQLEVRIDNQITPNFTDFQIPPTRLGEQRQVIVVLRNVGNEDLVFSSTPPVNLATGFTSSFSIIQPALETGNKLSPNGSTAFAIRYHPELRTIINQSATVTIPTNAQAPNTLYNIQFFSSALFGRATLLVDDQITPNDALIDFGEVAVGDSLELAVEIRNDGNDVLNVADVLVTGDGFECDLGASAIAAGDSVTGLLRFAPNDEGLYDGSLQVISDDIDSPTTVALEGLGIVVINEDCNSNGVEDSEDIATAYSDDCDSNGVPDECQIDSDSDGQIDPCDQHPDDADNGAGDDQNTNGNNDNNDNNDDDQNTNGNNDDVDDGNQNNDDQNGDDQHNDNNGDNNQQDDTVDAPAAQGNVCGLGSGLPLFALFGGMVGGRRVLNRRVKRDLRRKS